MKNLAALKVKANARYICQECGSTELIQAHHEIPGDDNSLVALCAECHSKKHPDVPRALFFNKRLQPYWHNKSASSIAKELGVHPRTVIRTAKKLGIVTGELDPFDDWQIRVETVRAPRRRSPKSIRSPETCPRCSYIWEAGKEGPYYCPRCGNWAKRNSIRLTRVVKIRQPSLLAKGAMDRLKNGGRENKEG